jgi:phage tail-like protein
MALGDITGKWPYIGYNFDVRIDGSYYSFKEVSGLEIQVQVKAKTENHIISSVPTGERKFSNVTLKRGMLPGGSALADWAAGIEASPANGALDVKNVDIYMMDDQGNDIMSWHLEKAWPVKYTVGPLNASDNSIVVESLELAYRSFEQVATL